MLARERELRLRTPKQIAAVMAPVREDIVTTLGDVGPLSVAELAERLERPASGLYHHLRILDRAGIVTVESHRRVGKRDEAIWALVAHRILIDTEDASRASIEATKKATTALMRETARDLTSAIDNRDDDVIGLRAKARLSRKDLRELKQLLGQINELMHNAKDGRGRNRRMYSITFALAPSRRQS